MDGLTTTRAGERAAGWPQQGAGPDILMRTLAAAPHFRSASVEELVLQDDFFRRPLRPEDLAFLDFSQALRAEEFGRLSCLMAQRTLLSLTEAGQLALPETPDGRAAFDGFYDAGLCHLGDALVPLLNHHVFAAFAGDGAVGLLRQLEETLAASGSFWRDSVGLCDRGGAREQGRKHILIQAVPLWKSVAAGEPRLVSGAAACRRTLCWSDGVFAAVSSGLEAAARQSGLSVGRHSYWQFYLTGTLATVNLLHKFAASTGTICEYAGARLVAEAHRTALCEALGTDTASADPAAGLLQAAAAQLDLLTRSLGPCAAERMGVGASAMGALLVPVRADLAAQLGWLSDIAGAERAAHEISARIESQAAHIDRDIFVEPREMCSTTHVHDEHRLVVVESGEMVFWGTLGMRHCMGPGEMILIPKARLHGSNVLTQSCTYHQPIIPDDWREHIPSWRQASGW